MPQPLLARPNSYGFKPPIIEPDQYVFGGATKLTGKPLTDGHWLKFLPELELQYRNGFDTNGCTEYGHLNALETLFKVLYGTTENWSERFIAVLADNQRDGNDPHTVIETIRKCGLIDEVLLPFDNSIASWEMWKSPRPMTSGLVDAGLRFTLDYDIRHDWVPDNPEAIKEALRYSPLGVSVYAWTKNEFGLSYFPPGLGRNHWCALVDYEEGTYWTIFDSYEGLKKVTWDSKFIWIKRYSITKVNPADRKSNIIRRLIDALISYLPFTFTTPKPLPQPSPSPKPMNKLHDIAKALIGTDASPKDIVRDGVGCAESVSTIIKKVLPTFPIVTGTWSLWDALRARPDFEQLKEASVLEPGDIILCATGTGNDKVPHGHAGILSIGDGIMSNDSLDGKWKVNFTRDSWQNYFVIKGGYPVHYFRLKS